MATTKEKKLRLITNQIRTIKDLINLNRRDLYRSEKELKEIDKSKPAK